MADQDEDIFSMVSADTTVDIGGEEEMPSRYPRPKADPGRQTLRRDTDKEVKFYTFEDKKTGNPILSANIPFIIRGGEADGSHVYAFIGTRKFANRNSNKMRDYLRGAGFDGVLDNLGQYRDATRDVAEDVEALLGWQLYCESCEETKYGFKQSQFEKLPDGRLKHTAQCPDCNEEAGARLDVVMFLQPKKDA